MRFNNPLDKILNNEAKVRALRVFCQTESEMSGRQIAKLIGVTPKTSHEILQDLLKEGVLIMRTIGKTYLFSLNEERTINREILKPLFLREKAANDKLFHFIQKTIKKSSLKDDIISVVLFGSVHKKTEHPTSDVDLFIITKTSAAKKKVEKLFYNIDQLLSAQWGNLISPYINSIAEFKANAEKKNGPIPDILKSYKLIYGKRLEKLLR